MSKPPAVQESAEVAVANEADLIAGIRSEFDSKDLVLPIVKLLQQLSSEVTEGKGQSGEYVNSLTGDNYGEAFELVVCGYFKGRFWGPEDQDRSYSTQGDRIPEAWPHADAGKLFADSPEAEEQWSADSNEGIHPWGSGPPIETTHNFVGFVRGESDPIPVRLSLKKTSTPAARKIITLIQVARAPWDNVFQIGQSKQTNKQGKPYFVVEVKRGDATDAEERQKAVELATQLRDAQDVVLVGDDKADAKAAPAAREGALDH